LRSGFRARAGVCDLEAVEAGTVRFAELRKRGVGKALARKTAGIARLRPVEAGGTSPALLVLRCSMLFDSLRDEMTGGSIA